MKAIQPLLVIAAGAGAMVALTAAQRPVALAQSSGGMWEVSGVPGAKVPARLCVADPTALAQFEHRGRFCTRIIISDNPPATVIHYTCPAAGFGRSKMTAITPRSIRIETQGIAEGLPFNYVAQARRVGDCHPR